jgi:predicted PurR-regulated permease PerM
MGLISSKNKNNTFNPKELNRKQLQQQNLIFIVIAIIIIIALIGVVGYFINFVVAQMNLIFQSAKETNVNLEGFDLKGFNEIKEKIKIIGEELEKLLEEVNKNATTTAPLVNEEVSNSTVSTSTPAEIKEGSSGTSTLEINQSATSTPTASP